MLYRFLLMMLFSMQLSASPLTTQLIDIPNMHQAVIQTNLCPLTPQNWYDCEDKMVKLIGYLPAPHQILPAPILAAPNLQTMQQADEPTVLIQSYINAGERQVILLSKQPIQCLTDLEVIGRLESVDLGGAPHTKSSYQGWSLYVDNVQCLP